MLATTDDDTAVLTVAPLPADLAGALAQRYTLIDGTALRNVTPPGPPRPGIRIAVTTSMHGFDAALMEALPDLGLIACQGVGLDSIDRDAAAARGIAITHTPNIMTEDVADFAMGLLHAVARRIVAADRFVRDGRWGPERMAPSTSLHGKSVGVVGLGRIGRAIARRAAAAGMAVAWHGPTEKPGLPYRYHADIGTLADASDILILSCPGGPETRHIVDAEVLSRLGTDGIVVNVARGSVVDEAALLDALEQGRLFGAGLDVFASEPALDPRFLGLSNVVLAPHCASITDEVRRKLIACIVEDIDGFRAGAPPRYSPERNAGG